jgi:serine/threonine protein kinase
MQVFGFTSYTKLKPIGVGQGMNSEVYLVVDGQLGGEVAAKEIPIASFSNPAEYFKEAQAMFAAAHDNVVAVHYACHTPSTISLIMPYYPNGSLADRIGDRPLQLSEVERTTHGVLAGLAHIHLNGYIHFDIKPSNVFFSNRNKPMVADFGQSRAISETGVVSCPRLYMFSQPPETIATGLATSVADIYHVGLLMYRALNGEGFYQSQIPADPAVLRDKILRGKFPDRARFMPHVPQRIRTIVRKALKPNPADRFQTATEMADVLSRVNVTLDWSVEPLTAGGFCWRAKRPAQCDLVVELNNSKTGWDTRTFTEQKAKSRRAKDKPNNWRTGLSLDDALAHLEKVFERLPE